MGTNIFDLVIIVGIFGGIGAYLTDFQGFKTWINSAFKLGGGGNVSVEMQYMARIAAIYINCKTLKRTGNAAEITTLTNRILACCRAKLQVIINNPQNTALAFSTMKSIATTLGKSCTCNTAVATGSCTIQAQ